MNRLFNSTAIVLVCAVLGAAAMPSSVAVADDAQVSRADCNMNKAMQGKVKEAARESSAASAKSSQYISDEKARAESEKKNGKYEILADFQRTGFSMDVPEITVGSDDMTIPTVHIAMKTTSLNIPVPGQCKVGSTKIPEWHGPWTMRWVEHDILVPCVTTKQAKLDLPDFTAGTTAVQVPKITVAMKTREFSLHLPQFTERTPDHEMRKHEDNIAQEEARLKQRLAATEQEYERAAMEEVSAIWQTARDTAVQQLEAAEKMTVADLSATRADLAAKISAAQQTMREAGASADAISQLAHQRQLGNAAIDVAEADTKQTFAAKKKALEEQFDDLRRKYLEPGAPRSTAACAG